MVNNQATIAQWRIKNKQNCGFYWLSTVNPYPLSLNTNILYLLTMFCDTDISSLCNLHCSKKINMEVVIKAMDILNQFGWHHFISDCISHFLYQLPQFMITCIYTWHFLSYSYNDPKYNIHSQYHIYKITKEKWTILCRRNSCFLLLQLAKIWNTSTKGGIMVQRGAYWLNKLSS